MVPTLPLVPPVTDSSTLKLPPERVSTVKIRLSRNDTVALPLSGHSNTFEAKIVVVI